MATAADPAATCRHHRLAPIEGQWRRCRDCGVQLLVYEGRCYHQWQLWLGGPYQRCVFCGAVEMKGQKHG